MKDRMHRYAAYIEWPAHSGERTRSYDSYSRNHVIRIPGKPEILASSDVVFRGDDGRHDPEDLLLAAVSSCHMLWFLHLATEAGVVVAGYSDEATGTMTEDADGKGRFTDILLRPRVTVLEKRMIPLAADLHERANRFCFIANSLSVKVRHEPEFIVQG